MGMYLLLPHNSISVMVTASFSLPVSAGHVKFHPENVLSALGTKRFCLRIKHQFYLPKAYGTLEEFEGYQAHGSGPQKNLHSSEHPLQGLQPADGWPPWWQQRTPSPASRGAHPLSLLLLAILLSRGKSAHFLQSTLPFVLSSVCFPIMQGNRRHVPKSPRLSLGTHTCA